MTVLGQQIRDLLSGHQWPGGYLCACGHQVNSAAGYLEHLTTVLEEGLDRVLRDHLPPF